MSEGFPEPEGMYPAVEPPPRPRSWAWLAWLVIVAVAGYMVLLRTAAAGKAEARDDRLGLLLLRVQGRYLVGAEDFLRQKGLYKPAKLLSQGTVDQRLRFIVLAGELAGPAEALKQLDLLDKEMSKYRIQATPEQARSRKLLGLLYRDYQRGRFEAPSLAAGDRDFLRKKLEWFGDLALAPAGLPNIGEAAGGAGALALADAQTPKRQEVLAPARDTFVALIGGVTLTILLGLAGFIGLIVLLVLAARRNLTGGIQTGTGHGGIYAETFALWFFLFFTLSHFGPLLLGNSSLILSSGLGLFSLLALAWPVLRGIPWHQVRRDVGLTLGRQPSLEPAIGLGCYVMAIPVVFVGLLFTLVLIQVTRISDQGEGNPFAPSGYPSHPIVEALAGGNRQDLLVVLFLASVAAPVVEETMFRGVLYRHLREASARFGLVLSILASAGLTSFLFAVIHPQGLLAVPVLMSLALGFTLAREWRGSLVPGMVGHALNNALVVFILFLALGD